MSTSLAAIVPSTPSEPRALVIDTVPRGLLAAAVRNTAGPAPLASRASAWVWAIVIEGVADERLIVQAAGAAAAEPSDFESVTPPAAVFATRSESSRRWWGLWLVTVIWPVRAAKDAVPTSESPRISSEPPRTSIGLTRQPPLTAGTFGASTAAASSENVAAMKA